MSMRTPGGLGHSTGFRRAANTIQITQAALGIRAHSGWAAVVVVAGPAERPVVSDRRRVVIADSEIAGSKQPYHAAEGWPLPKAKEYLERCAHSTKLLARRAIRAVVQDVSAKSQAVVGCGILTASGRAVTSLEETLASHALIHTAEGEFFRNALAEASEYCQIPVTRLKEKELLARGAADLGIPVADLPRRLSELGRGIGPPWSQDEKYAALVAWVVITDASRRTSGRR